jgi:hypothetical protein
MINGFDDVQKLGQSNVDNAMKAWGEWSRNWQAVASGMSEYSKRSFEDGTATFQKLMGAKSLDQAFEIQSSYARRAYEQYMQEMNKIGSQLGSMYAGIAKDAMKPAERIMQTGQSAQSGQYGAQR